MKNGQPKSTFSFKGKLQLYGNIIKLRQLNEVFSMLPFKDVLNILGWLCFLSGNWSLFIKLLLPKSVALYFPLNLPHWSLPSDFLGTLWSTTIFLPFGCFIDLFWIIIFNEERKNHLMFYLRAPLFFMYFWVNTWTKKPLVKQILGL